MTKNTKFSTTLLSTAFIALLAFPVDAASIKDLSVINSDVVHLGDIFDGSPKPDTVLGKAPLAGQDMVLNIATLKRLANTHKVEWAPASVSDTVTIRRDAHTIDAAAITETLKTALAERGVEGTIAITLNTNNPQIVLPADIEPTLEVTRLDYTPGKQIFTATLVSPSAAKPLKTLTVSGLMDKLVQVPALSSSFKSGDIIGSGDLTFIDLPERDLTHDIITDADKLIGKTPSRILTSGRAVRLNEVTSPQLVARGDEVTIEYMLAGMNLTAKGKSLQTGAAGEIIRVTNLTSNKSVSAKVTGDRVVTVQ